MRPVSEFLPLLAEMLGPMAVRVAAADEAVQEVIEANYVQAMAALKKGFEHDRRSAGQRYRHHFAWHRKEKT